MIVEPCRPRLIDLVPVGGRPWSAWWPSSTRTGGSAWSSTGPGRRIPFHCTAITDGTRQIAVGTVVAFVVSAGRLGRLEARSVRPLPGVVPPGIDRSPPRHARGRPSAGERDGRPRRAAGPGHGGRGAVGDPGAGVARPRRSVVRVLARGSIRARIRTAHPRLHPNPQRHRPVDRDGSIRPRPTGHRALHRRSSQRVEPVPVPEVVESGEPIPPAGSDGSTVVREESPASPSRREARSSGRARGRTSGRHSTGRPPARRPPGGHRSTPESPSEEV